MQWKSDVLLLVRHAGGSDCLDDIVNGDTSVSRVILENHFGPAIRQSALRGTSPHELHST